MLWKLFLLSTFNNQRLWTNFVCLVKTKNCKIYFFICFSWGFRNLISIDRLFLYIRFSWKLFFYGIEYFAIEKTIFFYKFIYIFVISIINFIKFLLIWKSYFQQFRSVYFWNFSKTWHHFAFSKTSNRYKTECMLCGKKHANNNRPCSLR